MQISFDVPEYSGDIDALGTLRILEAVRILGLTQKCKIYQASTSELYGKVEEIPQTEKTPFLYTIHSKSFFSKISNCMLNSCCNNKIFWNFLLHHQPHTFEELIKIMAEHDRLLAQKEKRLR